MANKGFSVDMDNERDTRKRSKLNSSDLDFIEKSSTRPVNSSRNIRDDMWKMSRFETPPQKKTSRFIGFSIMAHAIFLIGLMTISAPLFEPPKAETVEIEIADPGSISIPRGTTMSTTQAPQGAPAQEIAAVAVMKTALVNSHQAKSTSIPAKQSTISKVQPPVATSAIDVPESVDDLEAPQLDENAFHAEVDGQLNEGDLDKHFEKVDHKSAKGVTAVAQELDQDAEQMAKTDLDSLEEMDRETQNEAQLMAARSNEISQKNAAALAAAQAQENSAREKARGSSQNKETHGAGGEGSDSKGSAQGSTGRPNGEAVRSLEQLRQMPGNPKPAYSDNERIAKQQGNVVFFAYISRDGYPTQFRQARSTGYSNLDGKTLDALKKWRFYPGQEGWVEIPFNWDLKGGASETRALEQRQAGAARGTLRTSD